MGVLLKEILFKIIYLAILEGGSYPSLNNAYAANKMVVVANLDRRAKIGIVHKQLNFTPPDLCSTPLNN